ncbi:MAG: xanthine dehydrogenase accessory protein XdhC [Proteobacteria bacterium]|nr:xanthine dehydrogenase accessory protein XdhC [Pseudomonadota bacterium]
MIALFERLAQLAREGEPAVLVTVVAVAGSAPREAGAKMAVWRGGFTGSIGGGQLEFTAIETARALIDTGATQPVIKQLPLGPELGQCCGGYVALLLEPIAPPALRLALFGAGHVARALVAKLADIPCRIDWIDPRAAEFPQDVPAHAKIIVTEDPEDEVTRQPPGTRYLVMTHSHDLDFRLVAAILRRGDFAYLGLIGSATKRARFERRLVEAGFGSADLDRLVCPIGLDGIAGKEPGAIAIAVAAQLLQALPAPAETSAEQWAAWRAVAKEPD